MFFSLKVLYVIGKLKKFEKHFVEAFFLENVYKSQQNDLKFHIRNPHFCL